MKILTAALLTLFCVSADARTQYAGQWDNVPDNVKSWFKSIRSPHGVPCCNISDGHQTEEDIRGNAYWIPNPAALGPIEWMEVPAEAVVYNAGNPTGGAVVWYVIQGPGQVYVRCFVPGSGT
jgi:hypothetical protein